jgi:Fe-S-cluster-containing hydrogenase component 2
LCIVRAQTLHPRGVFTVADNMPVEFDPALCDQSPYCPAAKSCPNGALYIDRKTFRPAFDIDKCTACAVCFSNCPHGAIREV